MQVKIAEHEEKRISIYATDPDVIKKIHRVIQRYLEFDSVAQLVFKKKVNSVLCFQCQSACIIFYEMMMI